MIKEGAILGKRYEVLERIGSGGMADVYKGKDQKLNRYVAIKVLKREFREDETFVRKFRTEAQSAAGLMHPNVVNVYDVGEDRGLHYMVMELVEGITLKDYIDKKGRLSAKEVISIAIQICTGIDAAHQQGIVHRDIKPQNIIISKDGKVKVTDFGIARAVSSNTISSNAMGSVHYTSPEQARGGFSDVKSDIYSTGVTIYEMATGQVPFDGSSTVAIAIKHLQEEIVAPSEHVPEIPFSLEMIILKCTQKGADRRYPTMSALIADLKRSLVDPEGDFVVIAPLANVADTVMITPEELERIQREAEYAEGDYEEGDYDEAYDDEYEDEYEEDYDDDYDRGKGEKDEINPRMKKVNKILAIVVAVIVGFIALFAIGRAAGLFRFKPAATDEAETKVKVPSVVGLTEAQAKDMIEKKGFKMKVAAREESEKYEEGKVSKQSPKEGGKLKKGGTVEVTVSTGLKGQEIDVPDVANLSEDEAKKILKESGFENVTSEYEFSDSVEASLVIGTNPATGSVASKDTPIKVIVSKGAQKPTVPDLSGKSRDEAIAALEAAGLSAGSITSQYSEAAAGTVISQGISPGKEVSKGSKVDFVLSDGPEPVEMVKVPSLIGKGVAEAEQTLKNYGLKSTTESRAGSEVAGTVIEISIAAGTSVEKGSTITLYVSDGSLTDTPSTDGQ